MSTSSPPVDVVGIRVLVGVQMVDISRLSAHPVPITTGGLITVAGQGPKDSNGAGKSSFIAALSLLHADEQWRLTSGASGAAELLFTAELAAQEGRWANAERGYVIGVFAEPGAATVAELEAGALTVWLRINRRSPYLSLRWTAGLHVPSGSTEAERAAGVDALWDALPSSNGRDDVHAGRLSSVLYGGHVRCVSFLSTSVRSSPAANLLAQPLNELTPARIFDAIATLTGLDRELEAEQGLRSGEHAHRRDVAEAEEELHRWEREMAVVEAGISRRAEARTVLDAARAAWASRCARHLADGRERAERIRGTRSGLQDREATIREQIAELRAQLETLDDDDRFDDWLRDAERRWQDVAARDRSLVTDRDVAVQRLEELDARLRDHTDRARGADGRDPETARAEHRAATAAVEVLLGREGAARAAADAAATRLAEAEADAASGRDLTGEPLSRLAAAGIPAVAVVDVVRVPGDGATRDGRRPDPGNGGVVVDRGTRDAALAALADLPGTVVVLTGDGTGAEADDTGHRTRIAAARAGLDTATAALAEVTEELEVARVRLGVATGRLDGAAAAAEAERTSTQIAALRAEVDRWAEARTELEPVLRAAQEDHLRAMATAQARRDRAESQREAVRRAEGDLAAVLAQLRAMADELTAIDLAARQAAWGRTAEDAEAHLLELPEPERRRNSGEWAGDACLHLDDVLRRCFPDGTPAEEIPAELRTLLVDRGWRRGGLEVRSELAPETIRALATHLAVSEQQDRHDQAEIDGQRSRRSAALTEARRGLAEAEQTCQAHRASLALGIKARLRRVAEEFDRLDQEYGGYGAGLDFPEPEPPTEPDKPWRWTVTPRWRRAEGQRMSGYTLRGNTAQMDEKAVKLVCAAALAGGSDRPLLLVLDELGRNLGKQHRREAVALFERIGRDRSITVIGALQDDMERYAVDASNLYVKLRRSSDAMPYNEAPVVVGDDTNRARVELLREWMTAFRPAPGQVGPGDRPEPERELVVATGTMGGAR